MATQVSLNVWFPALLRISYKSMLGYLKMEKLILTTPVHTVFSHCQLNLTTPLSLPVPVVNQYFEAQVYDVFVIKGNTAVFKCQIPSFVSDHVEVISWQDTANGEYLPPKENYGSSHNTCCSFSTQGACQSISSPYTLSLLTALWFVDSLRVYKRSYRSDFVKCMKVE